MVGDRTMNVLTNHRVAVSLVQEGFRYFSAEMESETTAIDPKTKKLAGHD